MIKQTIYTPETQSEIDYIEAFGKPNPQITALEYEMAKLKSDIATLTSFSNAKDTEIAALKIKVASLETQLAECKGTVTPPPVEPPAPVGDTFFADDFEGSTNTNLLGGWTDWKTKLPFVGSIYFNTQGGPPGVITEIRKDNNRNVLYFQITDNVSSGGTSRAQMTVDMAQELPFIHTSHRMKIHPDMQHLTNYSNSVRWMTLFELWNARDSTQGGDPAGSSRISISLFKDTGIGQPLYWHVAYEEMQPSESVKWQVKSAAKIPFDKWFTFDLLIVRGIGTAGKVKLVITEDGGQPVTVFDINNNTIYRNRTDLRIKQWQIFKLYASDTIMDWMRNAGKQISTMYNDVKWYKS
jgi:hypothetical protein